MRTASYLMRYFMSDPSDLSRIQEILSSPTEEGVEELIRLFRDDTTPISVRMEASVAIMHIAFGPPSPEANEELAVWLEAAGVDVDKMRKEVAETLATLRLWN
jgi:hypothetical protein